MMGQWDSKNDKMITSLNKQTVIFTRIRSYKTETNEIHVHRDTYNLSDDLLYPTFCHYSPASIYLLTDLDFKNMIFK